MSHYTDVIDADSPVCHWRLGESSGALADRIFGSTCNATLTGTGFVRSVNGVVVGDTDKAISFDGTNGYGAITTPNVRLTTGLDDNNAVTFEAWVVPSYVNIQKQILCQGSDGSHWRFSMDGAGKIQALLPYSGGFIQVSSTTTLSTSQWQHIAYTYDGTTVRFYLNGQPDGTSTNARTLLFTTGAIAIGRYGDFSGDYFVGTIDELAVYKTALSATRILAHYNAGVGFFGAATLTGAGSLTATGGKTIDGAATLTGAGSFIAAGVRTVDGAAAPAGTGTLTVDGLRTVDGVVSLTGAGDLSGSGDRTVDGTSALAGVGDFSAEGVRSVGGEASLTGVGDLSASSVQTVVGEASLSAAGGLSADGFRVVDGAAALAGTGGSVVGGVRVAPGSGELPGIGSLSAVGVRVWTGEVTLPGSGTLFGAGTRLAFAQGVLGASGGLSAEGGLTRNAQAVLVGVGSVTVVGAAVIFGSAVLTGRGALRVGLPQGPFHAVVTRDRTKTRVISHGARVSLTNNKTNAEV